MKFNYSLLNIGLFILIFSCQSQENFEGVINYRITYTSYDSTLTIDDLKQSYGKSAKFYSKNGNTKWVLSDSYYRSVTYLINKNVIYYLTDSDTIKYEEAKDSYEKIIEFKILEEKENILNHKCNILRIKSQITEEGYGYINRVRLFYFNPKFKLNPSWFLDYNVNNLNEIYSKTGSFPLKIVDEFEFFKIEYEATDIKSKTINNEVFLIDKNIPLIRLN